LRLELEHQDAQVSVVAGPQWYVQPEDQLLFDLSHVVGAQSVELKFN